MNDPLAFFLTWTTYGSWLPGDPRGWVAKPGRFMAASAGRESEAGERMHETESALDPVQRALVEKTVTDHCQHRGWYLHAVNCRTQHVHVVVTAPDRDPQDVLDQFKAWCTRRLKEQAMATGDTRGTALPVRSKWWTEGGSKRRIFNEEGLAAAIQYVVEDQDRPR